MSSNGLFSLAGRTALVTGATGHLGREMTLALAAAGAHVIVNARRARPAEEFVESLLRSGYSAELAVFDVSSSEDIEATATGFRDRKLNILVNNAYAGGAGNIEHADPAAYEQSYRVTLIAAHSMLRAYLEALRLAVAQDGEASIINVASMYGVVSPDQRVYESVLATNPPYYGAAKAALIQWTRYAACEFGKDGIRVNCLTPGPFPADQVADQQPEFVARLASRVPLGRVGSAHEIRGPLLFLASPAASFVNGANLVVDGGWTAW